MQPHKVALGGGTSAAVPRPPTTPSSASMTELPPVGPASGAVVFPLMASTGIRVSTQDGNAIMENAITVPAVPVANVPTSMGVDTDPTTTTTFTIGEVEEKATAELYS